MVLVFISMSRFLRLLVLGGSHCFHPLSATGRRVKCYEQSQERELGSKQKQARQLGLEGVSALSTA